MVEILSISVVSRSWILYNKFEVDKYFQINFGVSFLDHMKIQNRSMS